MHNFQVPILMPRPIEPSSLPNWQILIRFVDPLMPPSFLLQLHNARLDEFTLAFFRFGQLGAVLGPKGRGFEKSVPADDTADLLQCVWNLIHEPFSATALDEAGNFFLEAVVEGERIDDGSLTTGTWWCLAEEDQISGMRW